MLDPLLKRRFEEVVHAAAARAVTSSMRAHERAVLEGVSPRGYPDDYRTLLSRLHTLNSHTAALEALCHRFGLEPLTGIWKQDDVRPPNWEKEWGWVGGGRDV